MNLLRTFEPSRVPRPPLVPETHAWSKFAYLDLEVGAGNGMFAEEYCLLHSERALLSLERTFLRSQALMNRRQPNLFSYRVDAVNFVTHFLPSQSVNRIFILYPNPYPKAKQSNLRWHNMPFMECLLSRLKSGGELNIATNILSYRNEALVAMCQRWDLRLTLSESFVGLPRTAFERKYLARGEECWNMVFVKPYSSPSTIVNG